jgi:hypothetical protein
VAVKAGDRTGRIICMLVADCKQTSRSLLSVSACLSTLCQAPCCIEEFVPHCTRLDGREDANLTGESELGSFGCCVTQNLNEMRISCLITMGKLS